MAAAEADLHEIIVDNTSNEDAAASTTTKTTNFNEITVVDNISNGDAADSSTTAREDYLIEITIDCPKDSNDTDQLNDISSYGRWKEEMEYYLKVRDLWGVVNGSERKPPVGAYFGQKYGTWKAKDKKAREAIEMKLREDFRTKYELMKCNSAKDAWEKLSVTVSYYNLPESERSNCLTVDTRNYDTWKVAMEFKLRSQDLWGVIDGSEGPLLYKYFYYGKYSSKDRKALEMLRDACGEKLPNWIERARSAKFAWDRLSRANRLNKATYNEMAAATTDLNKALTGDINKDESWKDLDEIILVDIKNYNSWRIYMDKYLKSQHLWDVVNEGENCRAKEKKAYRAIKMACGPKLYCDMGWSSGDRVPGARAWVQLRNHHTADKEACPNEVILTPTNYERWKVFIRTVLKENHLLETLSVERHTFGPYVFFGFRPRGYGKFDRDRAYKIIRNSCGPEMLPHIMYTKYPKEAWDQLAHAEASPPEEKEKYNKMVAEAEAAQKNIEEVEMARGHMTKNNYRRCIVYLKQMLISRYLWDIVDGGDQPTVNNFYIWKNRNKAALKLIQSSCGPDILAHAQGTRFAQKAWYNLARGAGDSAEENGPRYHLQLFKFFEKDVVNEGVTREFLDAFPEAICDIITNDGLTLLHYSIMQGRLILGKDLIHRLSKEQLEIKTDKGELAISLAVEYNNMELVKLMVDKNSKLLLLENENGHIPFFTSAINDVALDLLKRFPGLATIKDNNRMTVFQVLSAKPSAFLSGHQYGFLKKGIYEIVEDGVSSNRLFAFGKALTGVVPYMNQLRDEKVKYDQAVQIVKVICPQLSGLDQCHLKRVGAYDAIYSSTIHGIVEFFTALTNSNPNLIHFEDGSGNGLYQHAVISRQVKIFQLISEMGLQKQGKYLFDKDKNNILHCAAFWEPSSLSYVSGAALKMQREIQWFQEVEKVVNLKYREMKNKKGAKPKALFTQQHKTLVKEGEKWIKEASQACMVVSTLIATVMFAAAFTVPGGNDQNTGFPMFLSSKPFFVFIVSDAVSLFASCTSILMFFTLLTARYSEQDFLMSLPRKLILGLFFLFVSIAFMMATFAATLVIVLHREVPWVYAPVICLATIPVVLFGALQFPLFFDIVRSTFGRGIFHKKQPSPFYNYITTKIQEFFRKVLEPLQECCLAGANFLCFGLPIICRCICCGEFL